MLPTIFANKKEKVLIGVIIFLIFAIPGGSFILGQRLKTQNNLPAVPPKGPVTSPKEVPSDSLIAKVRDSTKSAQLTDGSTSTTFVTGPTMQFQIKIEGRPNEKQAAKTFVGISQGALVQKPQYLLTFNVDVPNTGIYKDISLAGLSTLETHTAYIKSLGQIATSSAFVAKPTVTELGVVNLITGDVNEDNIIDSQDYNIVKKALGSNPKSKTWNPILDFNMDEIINNIDLGFISKNLGKIGAGGAWLSSPPASQSAALKTPNTGSPTSTFSGQPSNLMKIPSEGGFWLFVPQ